MAKIGLWSMLVQFNKDWANVDKKIALAWTDLTSVDFNCLMKLQKMPNATL